MFFKGSDFNFLKKRKIDIFFISSFIFIFILGFSTAWKIQDNTLKKQNSINNKKIAGLEEEINLDLDNRGKLIKTYEVPYSFENFGLRSPLFENKKMETNVYSYKRNTIVERIIRVGGSSDNPDFFVAVWQFVSYKDSPNRLNSEAVFDGWENFLTVASPLGNEMSRWDRKDYYISKETGLKYYWLYPDKMEASVHLEAYIPNTVIYNPIFVRLIKRSYSAKGKDDPEVKPIKESLTKLANSINYK